MSNIKKGLYDNLPVPESEGDRLSEPIVTQRSASNQSDSSLSTPGGTEKLSPQVSKKALDGLNSEFSELCNSEDLCDELHALRPDEIAIDRSNIPTTSSEFEDSLQETESKSSWHLSATQVCQNPYGPASLVNSSSSTKDELEEKIIDSHFTLVDGNANVSPGAISQDSSLFPDNLSRSSESGKSIDWGPPRSPDAALKPELCKSDKSIKSNEKKEKKKTSWYNMLNPTYKSRSDDFKRLFKDLPDSERLIVDYSCALQKDILVQGRLYVSQNYVCFYANIFRWETFVLIKCRDVTSMTKEKTARVIPNAIQISTISEKHFFTSFAARDKTFLMLFRIWQNALLEQPMSSQELWQWVHYSYGEELGLTSDDDDYVSPLNLEDEKSNKLLEQILPKDIEKDFDKMDPLVTLENSNDILEDNNISTESLLDVNENCEPLPLEDLEENMQAKALEECEFLTNQKSSEYPTDMSDTTESVGEVEDTEIKCPCCSHEGKEVLNAVFPLSVDQVFALVFTGSKFYYDLLASRKTYDIMESPWQMCPNIDLKMRQVTYTLTLNHSMAKSAQTTETQICAFIKNRVSFHCVLDTETNIEMRLLKHSKPSQVYTIDCDVVNTGIPYSDTFSVKSVYCLTRVSKRESRLRVFGCVRYKKSVWGLVKSLIEKSAMQGLADFATDLETALIKESECSSQQNVMKKARRRKRLKIDTGKNDGMKDVPRALQRQPTIHKIGSAISNLDIGTLGSTPDLVIRIILVTLVILLFLNMLLFYKLWSLEDQNAKSSSSIWDHFPIEGHSSLTKEDFLKLLRKQDALHRTETERWRDALSEVIKLIHLIESSLSELKNSIDNYSSTSSVFKRFALKHSQNSDTSSTYEAEKSS